MSSQAEDSEVAAGARGCCCASCQGEDRLAGHVRSAEGDRVEELAISSLELDGSPRLAGEDPSHIRALSEIDAGLPPIVVHRTTMRVVDGMHRVRAAQLRGDLTIRARYFEGDDDEAFMLGVRLNIAHGLPLSLADRKAAAARIVEAHSTWSDRAIAAATGLSDKTVAVLRVRSTAENPQPNVRVGRDGRVRTLNNRDGRQRAAEVVARAPETPVRQLAEAAGIPLATAQDVRQRVRRGEDPVPPRQRGARPQSGHLTAADDLGSAYDRHSAVQRLKTDPSLRFTQAGRCLLRRLEAHLQEQDQWDGLAERIPFHCRELVRDLARRCAEDWQRLAKRLQADRVQTAGEAAESEELI